MHQMGIFKTELSQLGVPRTAEETKREKGVVKTAHPHTAFLCQCPKRDFPGGGTKVYNVYMCTTTEMWKKVFFSFFFFTE